jgi:hypothetical protein
MPRVTFVRGVIVLILLSVIIDEKSVKTEKLFR